MGTFAIVLDAPFFDLAARIVERDEDVLVEAFLAQPRIEALDVRVLDRLARFDELQPHAVIIGPLVEHPAAQFRTIVRSESPLGRPRPLRSRSNTLVTRSPVSETSTSMARLSRLHSSSTAKARNRRPLIRLS